MTHTKHQAATDAHGEPVSLGEFNGQEIYPMPMFAKLAVADLAATAAWYEQALGFATIFRAPGPGGQPMLVHLRRRKYQDVLLVPGRSASGHASMALSLNFNADGEVDALAESARAAAPVGASAVNGPMDTPWNTRDLNVTDPAGNQLVFTARNPNPDPEQALRMPAMLDAGRQR